MTVFEQAFQIVVGTEGGYVNDPADPGGETKYGISKRAYPHVDIAALTLADAQALYQLGYWTPVAGDDLPPPLAFITFDAAVNCGVGAAARWLQAALGVAQDGVIGPATIAAAHAAQPGWGVMAEVVGLRLAFMTGLPTWRRFGKGWGRRLCRLPYQALGITT